MREKKVTNPTLSQVLELYGRCIYTCNVVELIIKWMYLHSGGVISGSTEEEINACIQKDVEKKQKLLKQPLGSVWREVLARIYEVPDAKAFEEAEKAGKIACNVTFNISAKGKHAKAVRRMKSFLECRNFLVHNFAETYVLEDSEEKCKEGYKFLKSKATIIKNAYTFFEFDYKMLKNLTSFLNKKEILEWQNQMLLGNDVSPPEGFVKLN